MSDVSIKTNLVGSFNPNIYNLASCLYTKEEN